MNILGPPGIGKTSFARNLANMIKDRKKFEDGILYVSLRRCESSHMFLTRLSLGIQTNGRIDESKLYELKKISSKEHSSSEEENDEDQEKLRTFIIQILRDKDVLLILDSCEDPLEDDCVLFVKELDSLLDACPTLKMLLTSRKYVNKLTHNQEIPYHLNSLPPESSIRLLFNIAPRDIVDEEIKELLNYPIPAQHSIYQQFPYLRLTKDITMLNHPFTLMLGGHPQAITLAAPMLESQRLVDLFQQLLESNIMDALEQKGMGSYASLRLSLDVSIRNLEKNKREALDLFKFIGLLPGGVKQNDLTSMWGDNTWRSYKESLIRASLLVFKTSENTLTLLPFMNTRAYELLESNPSQMSQFHLKLCQFYKNYCQTSLDLVGGAEFDLTDFVEKEANIWACIYRSINRKKDNNEYDEENEDSKMILAQSFKMSNTMAFKDLNYKRTGGINNPVKLSPMRKGMEVSEIKEDEHENDLDSLPVTRVGSKYDAKNKISLPDPNSIKESLLTIQEGMSTPKQSFSSKVIGRIPESIDTTVSVRTRGASASKNKSEIIKVEEFLVIYYVATVIRLSKFSDARKAIYEYKTKKGLSKLGMAHLYKLMGLLTMLSEQKDYHKAKKYFNKALECFSEIN